ncbi:MAG: hypothetical protein J5382_10115 [Bacteroidales bacterium]|nr:hypothetical protein [Bacteroidales bacterium]
MEFKFNDAKSARPGHLERCLCYDKYLKGYRCYVYDDISKYWCTQATTEHDPDGENHIVDYADFQVTEWASLSNENKPSLLSDLDEAAEEYEDWVESYSQSDFPTCVSFRQAFKAGAEWRDAQIPKLPDNVDEAAFAYENAQWEAGIKDCGYCPQDVYDAFKAGVEWMAGQGVTVDGIITKVGCKLDVETTEYIIPEESEFERGDKVIVQIRKK